MFTKRLFPGLSILKGIKNKTLNSDIRGYIRKRGHDVSPFIITYSVFLHFFSSIFKKKRRF